MSRARAAAWHSSSAATSCFSISRRPDWPAVPEPMRFLLAVAGSSRAAFVCGSTSWSATHSSARCSRRVRDRLDSCGPLVTYNGKSFDVPLLENRFAFNRQRPALVDCPHVDMVHPARRLWRGARPLVNLPGRNGKAARCRRSNGRCSAYSGRATCPASKFPRATLPFCGLAMRCAADSSTTQPGRSGALQPDLAQDDEHAAAARSGARSGWLRPLRAADPERQRRAAVHRPRGLPDDGRTSASSAASSTRTTSTRRRSTRTARTC